jgi:hypothetical protein
MPFHFPHPFISMFIVRLQAYHIKEMSSFSSESLSAAAKVMEPVSRAVAPTAHRASVSPTAQRFSVEPVASLAQNKTGLEGGSLVSPSAKLQDSLKIPSRPSIISPAQNQSNIQGKSDFDHIFSWTALPAAPRMLLHQRNRLSQQAAALFRSFDKDSNSQLSSVEFFEGMTSSGLSRDHVLHIMNIHKAKQKGYYSLEEFEDIFLALQPPEEVLSLQQSNLEPVDGDDDVCIIVDSPVSHRHHPNPSPLTRKNAGATF